MNSRGKKQANLTDNNLLEVWRFVDYIRHEDIIGNLPNWHFLNVIGLHTHHGDSLDFFCASQNLSRTATTTASLDLSGNSPYKTWAFWRFCPENEPNSAKMGGLQVPHSIHSKFPLWSGGRVNFSHMMIGPKWDFLPLGSFFQRKHTVFQRGGPREDVRRVFDVTRERDEDEVGMSLWLDRQTNMSPENQWLVQMYFLLK